MTPEPRKRDILLHLAATASFEETLARFPQCTLADIQALLREAAGAGEAQVSPPRAAQAQKREIELMLNGEAPALVIHVDGASRGNPGEAGAGALLSLPDGTPVAELTRYLGRATNNVAEYQALIMALEEALARGAATVAVRTDSELMVKQMRGEYRVKSPGLKPLHEAAQALTRRFQRARLEHVPRAQNAEADRLANRAIDEHSE